jgi:predicted metalloprotease
LKRQIQLAIAIVTAAFISGSVNAQERPAPLPEASPDARESTHGRATERTKDFIRAILGDTEDVWDELFREKAYGTYPRPTIVLATRFASSACGRLDVSLAPFYCAPDGRIYTDPMSLETLASRSGDFAAAYVLARAVGEHVQAVLQAAHQLENKAAPATRQQAAGIPPALEMQADCYAGVWTHSVRKRDLANAREVEDGSIVAVTVGSVSSDHDYAARRLRAFKHGLNTGDPRSCDPAALPR